MFYIMNTSSGAQDDRTLEKWTKREGSCHSRSTVAEVAKIVVISLCFYAFDISFSIFIYQTENTNNCITLLKDGWSLGAQEDRTALYTGSVPNFVMHKTSLGFVFFLCRA